MQKTKHKEMDFQAFPPDVSAPALDMYTEHVHLTQGQVQQAIEKSQYFNSIHSVEWTSNKKPMPNSSSRRNTRCVEEGEQSETKFRDLVQMYGYEIVPTTEGDDYYDRIDIALKNKDTFILIDVKAARRVSRGDPRPQQKYTWLELHKSGSLFSGKSTHFAFEVEGGFVLVDKQAVREYILKHFDSNQHRVESPTQALMKPYRRKGRFYEWISLVKVEDLIMEGGVMYLEF
jgi:hypothetical protein